MFKQLKFNKKYNSGFTLIELVVALAIIAILMAYAIPSYNEFSKRQALTNENNDLLGDLGFARSLAIGNGSTVTVSAKTVGVDTEWSNGWDVNETFPDGTLKLIRTKTALSNNVSVKATGDNVVYNNMGALSTPVAVDFTFEITPEFPKYIFVNVQPSGLASSRRNK